MVVPLASTRKYISRASQLTAPSLAGIVNLFLPWRAVPLMTWPYNALSVEVIHLASRCEDPMCELPISGTVSFWAALHTQASGTPCL